MSDPTPGQKAGAAALIFVAVGLIYGGLVSPVQAPDDHHIRIYANPDAGLVAGSSCLWTEALGEPDALGRFSLQADAGRRYVIAHLCAPEADAGEGGDAFAVPPEMFPLSATQSVDAYDGGPVIEVWDQDAPDAPFSCACAIDTTCTVPDGRGGRISAPVGVTLQPGFDGAGCRPKPCVEWAGFSSWPAACPASP